jgi:hypothetical protein
LNPYELQYLINHIDPSQSKLFVEHARQSLELKAGSKACPSLEFQAASNRKQRIFPSHLFSLVHGIVLHGGTPAQTLLALIQTYIVMKREFDTYRNARWLITSLVSGTAPKPSGKHWIVGEDTLGAWDDEVSAVSKLASSKWPSEDGQRRRLHWDFAAASQPLLAWYVSTYCDFNLFRDRGWNKTLCRHGAIEPLLLWMQRKAWSEIRFGIARCFGAGLPSDVFELLFAAALEAEGIPIKPTIHSCALMLKEPYRCDVYALVSRAAKGDHLHLDECPEL